MDSKVKEFDLENAIECSKCACFNLRKSARVVTQLFEDAFRKVGDIDLNGTQFTLLVHVFVTSPVTISSLAESLVMDRTTLARNLNPLSKKGYIEIDYGKDRRKRIVTLTEEGKVLLSKAYPHWKRTQEMVMKEYGKENVRN